MSQFFERNKKKGLVGLLALFQEKKKVATLVLVAVVGSGGVIAAIVGGRARFPAPVVKMLRAVHLAPPEGADLRRPAFSSKAAEGAAGRIYVPGSTAGSRPGVSSMDMVAGGNSVLQSQTPSAERLGGKTIQGVGRPENARGIPPGIPLSESEMKGGLARGDAAAVVRTGEAGEDEGAGGGGRGVAASTAPASRILVSGAEMSGARAVRSGPGGLVQRMSESRSRSLGGGAGGGGQLGRMSAFSQEKGVRILNAWNAGQGPNCDQSNDPLCELVVARAASKAGAKSLTNCPSCPKESGTHMAATSFDGKSRKQAGVVTSDDETPPDLDGQYVDSLIQEGDQFYEKINSCDDILQSTTEKLKGLQDNVLASGSAANKPYQELKDLESQADEACAAFSACMESCHALCSLACAGAFIYAAQRGAEAYFYQIFKFEPKYQDYADACVAYNDAASTSQVCESGQGVSMFQCRAEEEFPKVQETRHWQFACGGQALQ